MSDTSLTETQRTPPAAVAREAEKGLKLREEHGRGGTDVGVGRARQLLARKPVPVKDIKAMHAYFARHKIDKRSKTWGDPTKPSAGYIAWLLWGGEAGKAWADTLRAKMDD